MSARFALLGLSSLLLAGFAGCISASDEPLTTASSADGLTSVFDRAGMPFVLDDEFSRTLVKGVYGLLPVESIFVNVDLPLTEGGSAADDSAKVHMGLWLPDVPEGTKVPVIADIGPYYSDGDVDATVPGERLGRFLIENFVSHGYAVAQVSVFGSGQSTHCMDIMGLSEQLGIDAAVTFLGSQEWSNGAVGLIGRSYDGSTPWQAAMFGNPALKTIVPISGLIGMHELMWRNGSAEFRGPIMHNVVYGTFGIDSDPMGGNIRAEDRYTACPDYLAGPGQGAAAYATGDHVAPMVNDYWAERNFLPRALENYKGSVFLIHGLQDWNVDPHMAFPTYQKLEAAGLETKGLFGQWAHMYPDRESEHKNLPAGRGKEAFPTSVRLDWAQDLLEWFDHYLKGTGPKPLLQVEVQDNYGAWRVEPTFPPLDATWTEVKLSDATKTHTTPDIIFTVAPPIDVGVRGGGILEYRFPAFSDTEAMRLSGLPQLHLTVTPAGPGGQIFATIRDGETDVRLGHAIMDLRYAAGGTEMKPVAPGVPLEVKMEFFGLDTVLEAGHGIRLQLRSTGEDYLPSAITAPVSIDLGASVLRLPFIERGADIFFVPPTIVAPAE